MEGSWVEIHYLVDYEDGGAPASCYAMTKEACSTPPVRALCSVAVTMTNAMPRCP